MSDARQLALEVLVRCQTGRIPSDPLLAPTLARSGLDARDRRFVTQLVRTTHRWRGRADCVLDARLTKGVRSLDPVTINILRLAYVQMFHLEHIPPHAVVHTAVELAWHKLGQGKARLVNSVLRSLLGRTPDPAEWRRGRGIAALEGELSHPVWLLERWVRRWGEGETRRICQWNNQPPDFHLRIRGGADARERVRLQLEREGHRTSRGSLLGEILRIAGSFPIREHELLLDGTVTLQDESQALVGHLWPEAGAGPVFEMCAAPGTKASHVAELSPGVDVVAADLTWQRVRRIAETKERLGITRLLPLVADGRRPPLRCAFARVLLDAPCSGLGVLRRRPDARWLRTPGELADAARLQGKLLEAAAPLVLPGGWLLYSVCSLEPEETTRQVDRFLDRHRGFDRCPLPGWTPEDLRGPQDTLMVRPGMHGMEGVFAALLHRRSTAVEAEG
jgi:16S rRNA (cytosine967-C5)-methyltransferase